MIRIVEVGPRDGLQNEPRIVPTETKVAFIDALSRAGFSEIEAGAFVSPDRVPQLADSDEVFRRIRRAEGVVYSALVPNEKGLERALASRVDKVAVFTAASETFNRKNINATIDESLRRFEPVIRGARSASLPLRGYLSTAFWCPYEGKVSAQQAAKVTRSLFDAGVDEVSIGDTIGKATADDVSALLDLLLTDVPADRLAMHFHDTHHHALDNVRTAMKRGIRTFDSSVGGLGGCPFAPGASGNVATEALVAALAETEGGTGVDLAALAAARETVAPAVGRSL